MRTGPGRVKHYVSRKRRKEEKGLGEKKRATTSGGGRITKNSSDRTKH